MEIVIIALTTGMNISPCLITCDLIFKYTICGFKSILITAINFKYLAFEVAGEQTNTFYSVTGYMWQVTLAECQVCIMHEVPLTGPVHLDKNK